jgi:hypothetical protein
MYYSGFVLWGGISLSRGLFCFIPEVALRIPHGTYLLTCCSASLKQVWSRTLVLWDTSCFLSERWRREALYRLGVQGVGVLLILGGFFLPSMALASQQEF